MSDDHVVHVRCILLNTAIIVQIYAICLCQKSIDTLIESMLCLT